MDSGPTLMTPVNFDCLLKALSPNTVIFQGPGGGGGGGGVVCV